MERREVEEGSSSVKEHVGRSSEIGVRSFTPTRKEGKSSFIADAVCNKGAVIEVRCWTEFLKKK